MREAKVLVAADQALFREGLIRLLAQFGFKDVLGAADGLEALAMFETEKPDVVLLDIDTPEIDGISTCRRIKRADRAAKVIMLTMHGEETFVFNAIKAGAFGYVLKSSAAAGLKQAIDAALNGSPKLDSRLAAKIIKEFGAAAAGPRQPRPQITSREREVLDLIVQGMSNQEIAGALRLSEHTVKNHVRSILEKLLVDDRTQAAIVALKEKLV